MKEGKIDTEGGIKSKKGHDAKRWSNSREENQRGRTTDDDRVIRALHTAVQVAQFYSRSRGPYMHREI